MRNFLKFLLIPLFIAIVAGTYNFYLNRQIVDVRYTLSENIPINMTIQSSSESVQQLVVKNLGNSKAEKIIVNIQGKINSYDLIKYAQADTEQSFKISNGIQIIYPELPPSGSFKVIIRSEGNGIKTSDIVINHNKGTAIEALSNSSSNASIVFLIVIGIYILIILVLFRGFFIDSLQRNSRWSPEYNKILVKMKVPWYISERRWQEIRQVALDTMVNEIDRSYSVEIEECKSYKFLSSDKPDYLKEDEWQDLLTKCSDIFERKIGSKTSQVFFTIDDTKKLLKLKKPKYLNENKWNNIRNEIVKRMKILFHENYIESYLKEIEEMEVYKTLASIKPEYLSDNEWSGLIKELQVILANVITKKINVISFSSEKVLEYFYLKRPKEYDPYKWDDLMKEIYEQYIFLKMQEIFRSDIYLRNEKLLQELKNEKIKALPSEYWDSYIKFINQLYRFNVIYNIYNKKEPIKFINNQPLNYLDEPNSLKKQAYSIQLVNYYIQHIEESYLIFEKSDRPEWIDDGDYNKIRLYLKEKYDLNSLMDENQNTAKLLKSEKLELLVKESDVKELKERITNQLGIVNDILSNPRAIERIEEYNNTFSKGNFDNLLKIAEFLSKI